MSEPTQDIPNPNFTLGTGTLSSGTVNVSASAVTVNSIIFVTDTI